MNDTSHAVVTPHPEAHHSAGAALRFFVIALTAFLTVVDLFATQAILPSLTKHYGVSPAQMGFAVNASTLGMAFSGLAVGYFSRADRSPEGHPDQPRRARHPDRAARACAGPHHLHAVARIAGIVHGGGLHAHARLSRRALQRRRFGRRLRRLYHRQRGEQSHRAPDLGGRGRSFRARRRISISSPCSICLARCWSISPLRRRSPCMTWAPA